MTGPLHYPAESLAGCCLRGRSRIFFCDGSLAWFAAGGLFGSKRHAPVEQVFEFWSNPENFAKIMEHVQEVKRTGENRFRWTVSGPAGSSISWTSRITQSTPNETLVWRSEPGSVVRSGGIARFQPTQDGATRIHLLMSYNPPAGAIGQALATLFGVGPKSVLDEGLIRVKSLFEHGKTTAHGEKLTGEQLSA